MNSSGLFLNRGPQRLGVPDERSLLVGVKGQVFVAGVEAKATLPDLTYRTLTLILLLDASGVRKGIESGQTGDSPGAGPQHVARVTMDTWRESS